MEQSEDIFYCFSNIIIWYEEDSVQLPCLFPSTGTELELPSKCENLRLFLSMSQPDMEKLI